jgi:hypothetical protein
MPSTCAGETFPTGAETRTRVGGGGILRAAEAES